MKKYIEFKKQRELGDILSDTFGFIRNEFKPFFKTILKISGPYLVLFLFAMAFYLYSVGDLFDFGNVYRSNAMNNIPVLFIALIGILIFGVLAYVTANSAAIHYIKSYIENNGNVNIDEVKQNVKQTFMSLIGLGILKWITIFFAALLCFFPVLYIMVPMTIVFCVFIFEKRNVSDSYSHSFTLTNNYFWMTLLTVIVIGIIVYVANYAFSLPAGIYSIIKMGVFSGEINPENMGSFVDPIYIVLNVLSYFFNFLLNFISIVGSAFIYFNLNERMNFTGTLERINTIGKTEE